MKREECDATVKMHRLTENWKIDLKVVPKKGGAAIERSVIIDVIDQQNMSNIEDLISVMAGEL